MTRHTTFSFTLAPSASQAESLRKHVGAARFAFNQCLRFVQQALDAKKEDDAVRVPWSGFDLINAFNAWKLTGDAGLDDAGQPGLPWRADVCQQVFEEGAVDLGNALAAFTAGRKGTRRGKAARFPRFKKKATDRASFRLRNKGSGSRSAIRVGVGTARSIRLPKLGELSVREARARSAACSRAAGRRSCSPPCRSGRTAGGTSRSTSRRKSFILHAAMPTSERCPSSVSIVA